MARLSVEHFRAKAANTPDGSHKSSRFRDIFKLRSSMDSDSEADHKTSESSKHLAMSPTTEPGFEQVGILPNKRASLVPEPTERVYSGTPVLKTGCSNNAVVSGHTKPDETMEASEATKNKVDLANEASKDDPQDNDNKVTTEHSQNEQHPATESAENQDEPKVSNASDKAPSFVVAEEGEPVFESPFALGLASELYDNSTQNNGAVDDDRHPYVRQVSNILADTPAQNNGARADARSPRARQISNILADDLAQNHGARADARPLRAPLIPRIPTVWEYIERRIAETLANQERRRAVDMANANVQIVLKINLDLQRHRVASGGGVGWPRCIGVIVFIGVLAPLLGHDGFITLMGCFSIILTTYWLTMSVEIQN